MMSVPLHTEKTIFLEAAEIASPTERAAFLERSCGDDRQLRAAVEALLLSHQRSQGMLDSANVPPVEHLETIIGPYKLLQQIGEGGMGTVFMAEQTHPVQRKVALKVIKPGMDSRQVIARFEAERQALAIMDHVNIARVLDAGTTPDGLPYFVMELVHGVPITKYCDDNHLPPRQRLELFVPVCQAIQHAHQKGIIHRDIKPSNVMITLYDGKPVPKVIDFGVAKATEQKLTERTLFTQYGTMVGTLEYMSPEQAEMSALGVDTRSDIYSLGVLLYELLTGSTPLSNKRMKEAAYAEVLRMIREEEPPKPSTRLSESGEALASISAQRDMEPAKLSKLMRGELDWIVMKTLEKDRNRRYETANGFAADVERYLNDEPVQACPPSAQYRLRKFARRNKRTLITMTLLGVMLLVAVGAVAGSLGWVTRDRAARRMVVDQVVARALDESNELQRQTKWQEALVKVERAETVLASGEGSSELQQRASDQLADLQMIKRLDEIRAWRGDDASDHKSQDRAFSRVFADFGVDVEKLDPAEVAERIRRRPNIAVRVAAGLDEWAMVLRDWALRDKKRAQATWKGLIDTARLADPDPWRSELRQLIVKGDMKALRRLADSSDVATLPVQSLQLMGNALIFGGDGSACVAWLRKAHQQHPGDNLISFELAFHLSNLPSADRVEVLRFAEAALAARPQSASMYRMVGSSLDKLRRYDEAILNYRRALELNPNDAASNSFLNDDLYRSGKYDEAIEQLRGDVEIHEKLTKQFPDDPRDRYQLGRIHNSLGRAQAGNGSLREAEQSHRRALELYEQPADPAVSPSQDQERRRELAWTCMNLGDVLNRCQQRGDAEAAYRQALALCEKLCIESPGDDKYRKWIAGNCQSLAIVLTASGRSEEAEKFFRRIGELTPKSASGCDFIAWVLAAGPDPRFRDPERAVELAHKAVKLVPKDGRLWSTLGTAQYRSGEWAAAIVALEMSGELRQGGDIYDWLFLAMAHWQMGEKDKARRSYNQAIEWMKKNKPPDDDVERFRGEAAELLGVNEK